MEQSLPHPEPAVPDEFINPYEAPTGSTDLPTYVAASDLSGVTCALVYKNYQHRIVAVRGTLNAVVEWNATGYKQFIAIDGERIQSKWNLKLRKSWEFQIEGPKTTHHFTLETRAYWSSLYRGMRLTMDGRVIYADGKWAA